MKVKELIKKLKKHDSEAEVKIDSSWSEYAPDEINAIIEKKDDDKTVVVLISEH